MDRLSRIAAACAEIERARRELATAHTGNPLGGAFLGYMDWLSELHRLIHDWGKNDAAH